MSDSRTQAETGLKVALICGLLGGSGVALSDEPEIPDLALLEYLGSWEGSDEDWVLFSLDENATESDDESSETDPASQEQNVAELDDEN
jgi:hypothetical protein